MPAFRYGPVVQALPHHRAVAHQYAGVIYSRFAISNVFLKCQRPDAPADSFWVPGLLAAHLLARAHRARHGQVDILRPHLRRDKILWHVPGERLELSRGGNSSQAFKSCMSTIPSPRLPPAATGGLAPSPNAF